MSDIVRNIKASLGQSEADLVLKNASIVNVFTHSIEVNDIAINDDIIIGIGKYSGRKEIDCSGLYVSPGFIDAHVHIESSMVVPQIFSSLLLKRGVTTAIADPHEIANVLGADGIRFMLESCKYSRMDVFFMLPSCVPATPFEDNGASITAEDMRQFERNKMVLGLGEVMDVPSVLACREEIMEKIGLFKKKIIDGHCPGIGSNSLNAYLNCSVKTDHECTTVSEAQEKISRGMYVMLREGSAARNLKNLIPAINSINYNRFLFCTDDRHINDLIESGSIDNCIRLSISEGVECITAFTIASLNTAQCYGLRDRGAIAPGLIADLVIFEDLKRLKIKTVIKKGAVYKEEQYKRKFNSVISVNLDYIKEEDLVVRSEGDYVNIIKIIPGSIETKREKAGVVIEDGIIAKAGRDGINKIAVFERHKNSGKHSVAYIDGFGLKYCAIAQTIAHDSHNIIVAGDNEKDMVIAVNKLIQINGGIVIASHGKIEEYLALPVAGLMTDEVPEKVAHKLNYMLEYARSHGISADIDPFLTLAFMSLPVIPEIKLTPRGLFDYKSFSFINLFC